MAKAKSKTRTRGANLPVPQSREDAAATVARIGALNRNIAREEAAMNDEIAAIKAAAEAKCGPLKDEVTAATEGLKMWAEANRAALTNQHKTKTVDLGTGTISWRTAPQKVKGVPRAKDAVAELIKKIKSLGLKQFIRTSEEINREAMLADPDKAGKVPGIRIASDGEEFSVEPFEVEISGGQP
ncbi:host-nuclease inhibitor Gam family protein [Xanthobacter sp. VTT E-85241]|uniref:host-nuclease inhibitor Gam family protein n=1 Tax=Roseixanthobacter finlandensis TaxID=3119922 RepID=UPI00372897E6